MKTINNNQLINELIRELGLAVAVEGTPKVAEELVKITYPIIPKINIVKSASATGAIYTIPAGYTFYLTHLWVAAGTGATSIRIDRDGTTIELLNSAAVAGTAEIGVTGNTLSLYYPIVIKTGEVINLNTTGGTGGIGGFLIKGVG